MVSHDKKTTRSDVDKITWYPDMKKTSENYGNTSVI